MQRTGGPHGKTACFPVSSPQWLIVPRAGVAFREQRTDDQSAGLALSSAQTRLAPPDSSGLGDNIAGMIGTPKIPGTLAVLDGNSVERHMAEPERRPDRELPIRFHDGDREAFTALYRAHFPAVFRFAFYMTGDRILAGEIAQDVFVWLVHHPGAFDAERGELPAFLGGVARKLLHRRHQNDRRWLPLNEAAASQRDGSGGADFARGLEHRQDVAELRKAIAALPERYREAVVLCDLQEKNYQQAADELGCALGTVRSRLHRARELLARKFQCKKEGQKC